MPNGTYGGVRGRKTRVGGNYFCFPPTRSCPVSKTGLSTYRGSPNGSPVRESRVIAYREEAYFLSVSETGPSTYRGFPNGSPVSESCWIAYREGVYFLFVSETGPSTYRGFPNGHPVSESRGIAYRCGNELPPKSPFLKN